jgi:hypothetical protein
METHRTTGGPTVKHTARQTSTRTLTDFLRALDRKHAVTITVLTEEKDDNGRVIKDTDPQTGAKTARLIVSVRTVEVFDVTTTKDGNILIEAMDREAAEPRRFRLDRVLTYTLSRSAFQVERPTEDATTVEPPVFTTADDIIAFELARDPDDADHQPRHALAA